MSKQLSGRAWLSIITIVVVVLVLVFSRKEIEHAWGLMQTVNLWILLLIIPLQFVSYYAMGETLFAYLRSKNHVDKISPMQLTRLSLEMNFVNHILPSAGVSGISYMGWRLKQFGVTASKSTAGQLVRLVASFGGYAIVLLVAVFFLIVDGTLNRLITAITAFLVFGIVLLIIGLVYLFNHQQRLRSISSKLVRAANRVVRVATFGRKKHYFVASQLEKFMLEMRADYLEIRENKQIMLVPLIWGIVFAVAEVAMFYVTFVALGQPINPAPLVIAYGLAAAAGLFIITPGGAGAYEAIMVAFLTLMGISPNVGIAGIVLTRVLLLGGTIITGYAFYQQAIISNGKRPKIDIKAKRK